MFLVRTLGFLQRCEHATKAHDTQTNIPFSAVSSLAIGTILIAPPRALGQEEIARKVISRIQPVYPELARRMSIAGTVKLLVDVAPNGAVTNVKVTGGHPLLVVSAEEAVRKWKYAPAPQATSGRVELTFGLAQ